MHQHVIHINNTNVNDVINKTNHNNKHKLVIHIMIIANTNMKREHRQIIIRTQHMILTITKHTKQNNNEATHDNTNTNKTHTEKTKKNNHNTKEDK